MATAIGDLVVNLAAKTSQFDRSMRQAQQRVGGFASTAKKMLVGVGAAAATYLSARAVTRFVSTNLAAIDATSKLADRIGMSTEFIQAMGFAAEQTGMSVADMQNNLQMFSRRIGEAIGGTGEAVGALDRLGISADKISQMAPEDALRAVADGVSKIASPAEQAAVAADLFGRSGTKMLNLLRGGAGSIDAFVSEAERLGITFSRDQGAAVEAANDAWNRFKRAVGGVGIQLAVGLAPALQKISDGLVAIVPVVGRAIKAIGSFLGRVVSVAKRAASSLTQRFLPIWSLISDFVRRASDSIRSVFQPAIQGIYAAVAPVVAVFNQWRQLGSQIIKIVGGGLSRLIAMIKSYWTGVMSAVDLTWTFNRMLKSVIGLWSSIQSVAMSAVSAIIESVSSVISSVFDWNAATTGAQSAGELVGTIWQTSMNAIIDTIDGIAFAIRNFSDLAQIALLDVAIAGLKAFPQLENPIAQAAATFIGAWQGVGAFFDAFISNVIGGFQEIKNVAIAIAEGVKAAVDSIMSGAVGDAASSFADAFAKTLASQTGPEVRNPFAEMANAFTEGRNQALENFQRQGGFTATLEKNRQSALERIAQRESDRQRQLTEAARQAEEATGRVASAIGSMGQVARSEASAAAATPDVPEPGTPEEKKFAGAMGRGSAEAFSTILQNMTGEDARKPERRLLKQIARAAQRQAELAERAERKEREKLVEIPT